MQTNATSEVRVIGRYALYGVIAAGGMATVHFGRLLGPVGFSRTVAIKRLHANFASDPEFVSMFLDEARLAARVRHPNVIPTLDVVATEGELFLVMEYVPGETLAKLTKNVREHGRHIPHRMIASIMSGALYGLHAAHEAKDERGMPLGIVHRDVSPQNVHIGTDGVSRVLDFGVAKAAGRIQTTREGQIKGKLAYMPPEQLRGAHVTRQSDIYAAGVMLWELMTGQRLFQGDNEGVVVARVLEGKIPPPSEIMLRASTGAVSERTIEQLRQLDAVVLKAVHRESTERFATAREMARQIEECVSPATASQVGEWVERSAPEILQSRAQRVAAIESAESSSSASLKIAEGSLQTAHDIAAAAGRGVATDELPASVQDASNLPSNPSTMSVASSASSRVQEPKQKHRWGIYAGIGLACVFFSGTVMWLALRPLSNAGTGADLVRDAGLDAASLERPDTGSPEPDPLALAARPTPTTSAAPTTLASPSGSATSVHTAPIKVPWVPATRTIPTPPPQSCNPPFYMQDGIKRYKPECVGK